MIKQTLFIIFITTCIMSNKNGNKGTPGPKEMENRPLNQEEISGLEVMLQNKVGQDMKIKVDGTKYELVLNLAFANDKDNKSKSRTKQSFRFVAVSGDVVCNFDYSKYTQEPSSKSLDEQLENCKKQFEKVTQKSSESSSSQEEVHESSSSEEEKKVVKEVSEEDSEIVHGIWVPETIENSPMNDAQIKKAIRLLNLAHNHFLEENKMFFKEGVFHTDILTGDHVQRKTRNTFRIAVSNQDTQCNFLLHDNENNRSTVSEDLRAQIRVCHLNVQTSHSVNVFNNKKGNDESQESASIESLSEEEVEEVEEDLSKLAEFIQNLEDAYETKAVQINNDNQLTQDEKVDNYQVLEDEVIEMFNNFETDVQEKMVIRNNVHVADQTIHVQELEPEVGVLPAHKDEDFLKKLSEIYDQKNKQIQKELEDEKMNKANKNPEFIAKLEEIMAKKLKKYQDELAEEKEQKEAQELANANKNPEFIAKLEEIMAKKLRNYQNELDEEKKQKAEQLENDARKNPEFLQKLGEIYQKKAEAVKDDLNKLKEKKEKMMNGLRNYFKNLIEKKQNLIEEEEKTINEIKNDNKIPTIRVSPLSSSSESEEEESSNKIHTVENQEFKDRIGQHLLVRMNEHLAGGVSNCSDEHKQQLKGIFAKLVHENVVQNISLYDENFVSCTAQVVSGMKYEAVLSFNDEKCVVTLWYQPWVKENPVSLLVPDVNSDIALVKQGGRSDLPQCADRVGTQHLKMILYELRH